LIFFFKQKTAYEIFTCWSSDVCSSDLDGPMNGPAFLAYAEQVLAPELRPGDVVVMDNLPAHKISGVREAIEKVGARLLFLPPYSPDFNPIEMPSRSSKPCSGRPPPEPSTNSGPSSPIAYQPSHPRSVGTISRPPDMTRIKSNLL